MSRSVDELPPPGPTPAAGPAPFDGQADDLAVKRELRRMSRRGFAVAGAAAVAGFTGWRWVGSQINHDGIPWPLRDVLMLNEQLARGSFRATRLSPEFARSMARIPRENGSLGISSPLDLANWRLRVLGPNGGYKPRTFTIEEIKALPRVEMTTELRCIEGWSEVVYWAGAACGPGHGERPGNARAASGWPAQSANSFSSMSARDTRPVLLRRARHG